jgi:hypothetical protein
MSHKSVAILEKPVEKTEKKKTCCHHWIIEPALAATSEGRCKLCGARKTFYNVVEDTTPKSNLARLFEPEEPYEDDIEEQDGDDGEE